MNCNRVICGLAASLAVVGAAMFPAVAHERNQSTVTLAQRESPEFFDGDLAQAAPNEEQMMQMIAQCNSMMSMMSGMMGNSDMPNMMQSQPAGRAMTPQEAEQ